MNHPLAQWILGTLALGSFLGTFFADFDRHHIFNPQWPAHARFHSAAYAILNMACAAFCLWLVVFLPLGGSPSLKAAVILLGIKGLVLYLAVALPGTSAIAGPHEKVIGGLALSLWINLIYLALLAVGAALALS